MVVGLILLTALAGPAGAWAGQFTIKLEVTAGKTRGTAHAEAVLRGEKPKPRGVLDVKAGTTVRVKWVLRNADAKATFKDVLVHFFVVAEKELGQTTVPKLDPKLVVVETAQTADFKPKDQARGELSFVVGKAGSYLLRLETIGVAATREDNEYFAAMDLRVK
jgi:hypothetical protein